MGAEEIEDGMNHWVRLLYAAALTVLLCGIFVIVSAVTVPGAMVAFISRPYWVAVFVVSYLVAPIAGRYIKRR